MLIALIAAGLTLAVAGPALMDVIANDVEEDPEEEGKAESVTADVSVEDLLLPTDGDAPDDAPPDVPGEVPIGPADPDAPEVPPPADGDEEALAPTAGDAPEDVLNAVASSEEFIEAEEWRVGLSPYGEPAQVAGFRPGKDVLIVSLGETDSGTLDVTGNGGGDGLVMLNGVPLAVLEGAGNATLSDIHLLGENDPAARVLL